VLQGGATHIRVRPGEDVNGGERKKKKKERMRRGERVRLIGFVRKRVLSIKGSATGDALPVVAPQHLAGSDIRPYPTTLIVDHRSTGPIRRVTMSGLGLVLRC